MYISVTNILIILKSLQINATGEIVLVTPPLLRWYCKQMVPSIMQGPLEWKVMVISFQGSDNHPVDANIIKSFPSAAVL